MMLFLIRWAFNGLLGPFSEQEKARYRHELETLLLKVTKAAAHGMAEGITQSAPRQADKGAML